MHITKSSLPLVRGVLAILILILTAQANLSAAAVPIRSSTIANDNYVIQIIPAKARFVEGVLELSPSSGQLPGLNYSIPLSLNAQAVDTPQLLGSTYLGGSAWDSAYAVAVDSAGAIYIAGETPSADFPGKSWFGNPSAAQLDGFIVKLAPGGMEIVYAALLGGSTLDSISALQVENGIAYLAGETWSRDFPAGVLPAGENDVWAAAVTPDGAGLIYAVRFGGSDQDRAAALAVQNGRVMLTGVTWSADFSPAAASGNGDMFVVRLSPSGVLDKAVVFGGSDVDAGFGIDWRDGNLVVCGQTWSRNFAIRGLRGEDDGFVMLLDENLAMLGGTLIGGSGEDTVFDCVFTSDGKILAAGSTASSNLPGAEGLLKGAKDAFIASVQPGGTLDQVILVGGSDIDEAAAITTLSDGSFWVTGSSLSDDFPTTEGAFQSKQGGGMNVFAASYDPLDLAAGPKYATLLGGSENDFAKAIAAGSGGLVVVVGYSQSADFPVIRNPLSGRLSGSQDAFAAWFGISAAAATQPTATSQPLVPTATPVPTLAEAEISAAETASAQKLVGETPEFSATPTTGSLIMGTGRQAVSTAGGTAIGGIVSGTPGVIDHTMQETPEREPYTVGGGEGGISGWIVVLIILAIAGFAAAFWFMGKKRAKS